MAASANNDIEIDDDDDLSILNEAELEAKQELSEWIQCTLRQTFLQLMKQKLEQPTTVDSESNHHQLEQQQQHPDSGNGSENSAKKPPVRIAFSSESLQQCIKFVHVVSKTWQEKLIQSDHVTTASWVETVYQRGVHTLWDGENYESSVTDNRRHKIRQNQRQRTHHQGGVLNESNIDDQAGKSNEEEDDNESCAGDDKPKIVNHNQQQQQQQQHQSSNNNKKDDDAADDDEKLHIPYIALRNLGKKHTIGCSTEEEKDLLLSRIKQMGKSGNSYWPLDWKLIDGACSEIPTRFKFTEQMFSTTTTLGNLSYQVIPKSCATSIPTTTTAETATASNNIPAANTSPEIQQQQPDDAVATVLSSLLEIRKRKKESTAEAKSNKRHRKQRQQQYGTSRAPYDGGISSTEDLSPDEKMQLDKLICPEEEEELQEESSEKLSHDMHVLFAPLDKVGTIHNKFLDEKNNDNSATFLSDKEKRRKYRAGIQQRINPRNVVKNKDIQKFPSRVLRTEDRFDENSKYLDFDLGWSLMETSSGSPRTSTGDGDSDGKTKIIKKRYCAFSSLEIVLEDKEDP